MTVNKSILVIDNDTELTDLLSQYLGQEGFDVRCAHDGEQGLKIALNAHFDAIVLDVILPKINGFSVLKTLREHKDTPVLVLTSKSNEVDRIVGLEIGADDYLIKPFNARELVARLHTVLRRIQNVTAQKQILEAHGIVLDSAKRIAKKEGIALELTNTEFNILEMLIKSPGQAFSKEELTAYALGRKYTAFDRSIDVHISNLRNKLGNTHHGEEILKTVRGFGYLFSA